MSSRSLTGPPLPSSLIRMGRIVMSVVVLGLLVLTLRPAAAADPTVRLTPSSGPTGTAVHFEGDGFTDAAWQALGEDPLVLLERESGTCEQILAPADAQVALSAGHMWGSFTVPARATCSQSGGGTFAAPLGRYELAVRCVACHVGRFEITASSSSDRRQGAMAVAMAVLFVALGLMLLRRRIAAS